LVRTIATACPFARPPARIRPILRSALGGFYFQAFNGSVSLRPNLIQAKVSLQDIDPPIWRRLLLSLDLNLAQLHEVVQAAFAWTDSHLHQFVIGGLARTWYARSITIANLPDASSIVCPRPPFLLTAMSVGDVKVGLINAYRTAGFAFPRVL